MLGRERRNPPQVPACAGRTGFPIRQVMRSRDGFLRIT